MMQLIHENMPQFAVGLSVHRYVGLEDLLTSAICFAEHHRAPPSFAQLRLSATNSRNSGGTGGGSKTRGTQTQHQLGPFRRSYPTDARVPVSLPGPTPTKKSTGGRNRIPRGRPLLIGMVSVSVGVDSPGSEANSSFPQRSIDRCGHDPALRETMVSPV